MKAMMYKIGTGATEATVAGKVYAERRGDKEGEVSWTYCDGKLFARRANETEGGLLSLYDAENLAPLGEGKLLCGKVFTEAGPSCQ
jgi:hypothetical protein